MFDKGWSILDMFVFFGYYMGVFILGVLKFEKEEGDVFYIYVFLIGLGYVMMNGCWGKNYIVSDLCYNVKWIFSVC